jgi:hypothetical protein
MMSEGAVHRAVRRLRKRFKAILCERIAATLDAPDEAAINDEIRDRHPLKLASTSTTPRWLSIK